MEAKVGVEFLGTIGRGHGEEQGTDFSTILKDFGYKTVKISPTGIKYALISAVEVVFLELVE